MHQLRVSAVEPLTADSIVVELAVPQELAEDYEFLPGQHVSLRCDASETVQVTVVDPMGNVAPEAGVQVGPVSGGVPPATAGAP